jgi:beta-galactosidase
MIKKLSLYVIICTILGGFCQVVYGDTSFKRVRYSINANEWKFKRAEVPQGFAVSLDDSDWLKVTIPHDYNGGIDGVHNDVFKGRFDNTTGQRGMYKGPGWYRTPLVIDKKYEGKRVFLEFEAVSLEATVWINGNEVGNHKGGYTAFSFDITDHLNFDQPNMLAVRADNTNNPAIAPWMSNEKFAYPHAFDYAIYGGIYRDVWITITDSVKIEQVLNTPMCGSAAPTFLAIETQIKNYSNEQKNVQLTSMIVDPDGKEVGRITGNKSIAAGESFNFNQTNSSFGEVQFWHVNNPKVYKVKSILEADGKQIDQFESVFGIRYYTLANDQGFSLNNEKMLIRGINRHQDMEGFGYALPNAQHRADAQLIKDAGFNFVRHAHYPCDPEFAKACDELGLMLWLEIPLTGSTSKEPAFLDNCKDQLREMIEQFYNNPSVVIWGIGNESDQGESNDEHTNRVFGELAAMAKTLDAIRPTTGCNYKFKTNKALVDVYSPQNWNGWYGSRIVNYEPTKMIGEYGTSTHYPNHSEEKFDIEKDYRVPATRPCDWSQEYGTLLHEYKLSVGEKRMDKFPGHCVWVAFDFASPRPDRGINPLPFMNQKGIMLHDHKTKKDLYYLYQSMYRAPAKFPMVYIVSESWTDRWTQPEKKTVWVYSNCDTVELFNDKGTISLGKREKTAGPLSDTRFQWDDADVRYNVLHAVGYYEGKKAATHTIQLKNLEHPPSEQKK